MKELGNRFFRQFVLTGVFKQDSFSVVLFKVISNSSLSCTENPAKHISLPCSIKTRLPPAQLTRQKSTPFCSTPLARVGRAAARPSSLPLVGKTLFPPLSCQRGFQTHYTVLRRRKTCRLQRLRPSPPKPERGAGPAASILCSAAAGAPIWRRGRGARPAPQWRHGRGPARGAQGEAGAAGAAGPSARRTAPRPPGPTETPAHSNCTSRLRREGGERWQLEPPGIPAKILTPFETKLLQIHTAPMLRLPSREFPMAEVLNDQPFGVAIFLSKGSFRVELSHAFYL